MHLSLICRRRSSSHFELIPPPRHPEDLLSPGCQRDLKLRTCLPDISGLCPSEGPSTFTDIWSLNDVRRVTAVLPRSVLPHLPWAARPGSPHMSRPTREPPGGPVRGGRQSALRLEEVLVGLAISWKTRRVPRALVLPLAMRPPQQQVIALWWMPPKNLRPRQQCCPLPSRSFCSSTEARPRFAKKLCKMCAWFCHIWWPTWAGACRGMASTTINGAW